MRRPKYNVSQQIESLKTHGVTFDLYTEEGAQEFLTSRTYFFKIKAFENNFERDGGRYHGLDFAYLVDLSTIDCHLRTLLSYLCLNLEHALKVRFNQIIMEDANEDGYNIVHAVDEAGEFSFHGDYKYSCYHYSNYTEGLLNKYFDDPSIWNLWEVIDFSTLCKFYRAYLNQRQYKDNTTNLFQSVRIMRNASSHNNCLMIGIEKQINPTLYVKNCVKELNHGENPKQLFDAFRIYPLTHDFAATICGFLILVDSPGVRNTAKLKMQDFLQRLTKRYDYSAMSYQDCPKLIKTINALQSICKMTIDYLDQHPEDFYTNKILHTQPEPISPAKGVAQINRMAGAMGL